MVVVKRYFIYLHKNGNIIFCKIVMSLLNYTKIVPHETHNLPSPFCCL